MTDRLGELERRCSDLEELLERERKARKLAMEEAAANATALRVLAREVRAPLDSALAWSRMVRRELLSSHGRDHALRVVEKQIDGSMRLIDDLLTSVATSTPRPVRLRVDDAIRAAQGALAAAAAERGISVVLELEPIETHADPMRTERLLLRFVDTAISLAHDGRIVRLVLDEGGIVCTFDSLADTPAHLPASWDAVASPDGITQPLLVSLFLLHRLAEAHGARAGLARAEQTITLSLSQLPTAEATEPTVVREHEIRSPLQILAMGVELLRTRVRDSADDVPRDWLLERLANLEEAVDRLSNVADRFSASERPPPLRGQGVTLRL